MEKFKWFNQTVTLAHLSEGDVINPKEYVEKLKLFQQLGVRGTYIVEKSYQEYSKTGFHFYFLTTLIKYFSTFNVDKIRIAFNSNRKIACEIEK